MTKMSDAEVPSLVLEEVASDGSSLSNPAADHRRLFLGEDGYLHVKDSAGSVASVVAGASFAGLQPVAFQLGYSTAIALTTAEAVAANGGTVLIGFPVVAPFAIAGASVRNTDTGTQRTWNWDLYEDNGDATIDRVAFGTASETFTPGGAASTRSINADSVVTLDPGFYWLAVQNRHATNSFGLAYTATSNEFGPNGAATAKTTTNPNGATLDMSSGWTQTRRIYGAYLRGQVMGTTGTGNYW
jgi:hypothetical protein